MSVELPGLPLYLDILLPFWWHLVPFWFRYVVHFPIGRLTFGIEDKDVSGRNAA